MALLNWPKLSHMTTAGPQEDGEWNLQFGSHVLPKHRHCGRKGI